MTRSSSSSDSRVAIRGRSLSERAAGRDGWRLISSVAVKRLATVALALIAAVLIAGCGEKKETLGDTTAVAGPGVRATAPRWQPEYAHLAQRIKQLNLPPV